MDRRYRVDVDGYDFEDQRSRAYTPKKTKPRTYKTHQYQKNTAAASKRTKKQKAKQEPEKKKEEEKVDDTVNIAAFMQAATE